MKNIALIASVLLCLAVFPLPYGYYTFLRLVVTGSAIWVAWTSYHDAGNVDRWVLLFGLVAILFNPLFPVHLTRDIWFFIDLGVAGLFLLWRFSSR